MFNQGVPYSVRSGYGPNIGSTKFIANDRLIKRDNIIENQLTELHT